MSRLLTLLSGAAFAVAVFCAPTARAADEPKDILEKAIKAHGGADYLTKYKATQLKTKGKIDIPGVGEVDFTQEVSSMIPDKLKEALELKIAGQTISVVTLINGDKISIEVNGKEIDAGDKVKDALEELAPVMQVGRLVPLKDKRYELSLIGEDKVEGKKVVGIRVKDKDPKFVAFLLPINPLIVVGIHVKDPKEVSVYFDAETRLLTKLEYRTVDVGSGNEITEERIITEYAKNKDGVPVPKTVLIKRDGKKFLEAEVLEHKMLEKLDDSEFKK